MSVLTLAQAKTHLNITVATYDTELQSFIDAAEAEVADRCGPLEATAVTQRIEGGVGTLVLRKSPAISLTSVTPYQASALTLTDLYLDTAAGLVTYNSGASFAASFYTVVYSAGRATCPPDLLLAVKELTREGWEASQRGPARRTGPTPPEPTTSPRVIAERKMKPYLQTALA
jgi:hypothetical protein